MEEVKYIPGDLVMTDGAPIGTKKGVVYVVTASDPNRTVTFKDGTVLKGSVTLDAVTEEDKAYFVETSTWVKHIVPIPLTFTILEANGWRRDGGQYILNSGREKELVGFFIEMFEDVRDMLKHRYFQILHGNKIICGCFYVHQLQHLLFGLGLNSELKV